MKIVFICSKSITFNTFLKSQANYFIKRGMEVVVACSDSDKLNFETKLCHKINFPNDIKGLFNIINYIKIYLQIKSLVKKNPFGIFYLHTPLASHIFRLFTYLDKLKIIYFVHGFRFTPNTSFLKNFFFKTIEKVLSFKTSIFITINNHDLNYAKSNFLSKSSCYKVNGIGLNYGPLHFKKKIINKNEIKKIVVISAYKKNKGYLEILKVAEILKNRKIKIDCYGYGDSFKFNSLSVKKKLSNITFNDFDINLRKKIKDYDILLHLSKREGLPVAVMQCLAEGLPVICYNIRGNNDLIKDKINGFFVDSYKDIPNIISYLNLELKYFNKLRINALNSINENFFEENINSSIFNIINKHYNYYL